MSSTQVDCQYCGTPQFVRKVKSRKRSLLHDMLYEPEASLTSDVPINCSVCGKNYTVTLIGDRQYWRNNIVPSVGSLDSLKRQLQDSSLNFDSVINSMTGIVELSDGTIQVCLLIGTVRGYFECNKVEGILTILCFWRTC